MYWFYKDVFFNKSFHEFVYSFSDRISKLRVFFLVEIFDISI